MAELGHMIGRYKQVEEKMPPAPPQHLVDNYEKFKEVMSLRSEGEDIIEGRIALTEEQKVERLNVIIEKIRVAMRWRKKI
jgi:hypothetical protein